jgi:hypothetical protein
MAQRLADIRAGLQRGLRRQRGHLLVPVRQAGLMADIGAAGRRAQLGLELRRHVQVHLGATLTHERP